jgi:hypothetical protein
VMPPISKRIVPESEVRAAPAADKAVTAGSSTSGASAREVSAPESVPVPRKRKASADPAPASTKKVAGNKASSSTADEQAAHPMTTRSRASRAGSLREGGGSGATDTCAAPCNPSGT